MFMSKLMNRQNSNDSITLKALSLLPSYFIYRHWYNFLQVSQWRNPDQIEEYQLIQLSKLLHHAYTNVPYYKRVFNDLGLKPKDIQDFKDLENFPFLTRDIIKNNVNDLKSRNYPSNKFEYVTTGGSTGDPLGFYYERGYSRAVEWAFIKKLWDTVGYNFKDKCVIIKGYNLSKADKEIWWKYSLFGRWLFLSSFHLSENNLPIYIEKIKKFKPKFIQSFPSVITIIARFIVKNHIPPIKSLKAVLCGSENMYPDQIDIIQEAFKCDIYTWYGHAERVVLGGGCEKNRYYHMFPEYGITELIDMNGQKIQREDGKGIIVGTGLTNFIMPLIRYKTDDIGVFTNIRCNCGRSYQIIKEVQGKWLQEYMIGKDDRLIPVTGLNMHSDVFDNVVQYQFYQDTKGKVIINIVKKDNYTDVDSQKIQRELSKKLGKDITLSLQFVDHINPTRIGKYRFLIQKIAIDIGDL
jgi:phenylacetate-CoA ligase